MSPRFCTDSKKVYSIPIYTTVERFTAVSALLSYIIQHYCRISVICRMCDGWNNTRVIFVLFQLHGHYRSTPDSRCSVPRKLNTFGSKSFAAAVAQSPTDSTCTSLAPSTSDAPNVRFVFASVPNSGPNNVYVFGRIVSSERIQIVSLYMYSAASDTYGWLHTVSDLYCVEWGVKLYSLTLWETNESGEGHG